MSLVLRVEVNEWIYIGDNIRVGYRGRHGRHGVITIDAPPDVEIVRESAKRKDKVNDAAAKQANASTTGQTDNNHTNQGR